MKALVATLAILLLPPGALTQSRHPVEGVRIEGNRLTRRVLSAADPNNEGREATVEALPAAEARELR
jgi:hypothetical protein